ncbi:hypothetical protein ABIQ69_05070 [Agromyces sp. G08B096]|uniref:Membrane lipoprotein n=1 Tax=Agromyces sp. G08B096 TaxID=3156399 RepID=A0AAU7W978_9MICO
MRRLQTIAAAAAIACLTGCATAASPEDLADRAAAAGIAPDLVSTTSIEGYDLAGQSVGVYGDDGMSAIYVAAADGDQIRLTTARGTFDEAGCEALPIEEAPDAEVACTRDGDVWHREANGRHEYVVARDGALVRLVGTAATEPSALAEAAEGVHVPNAAELDALFADVPVIDPDREPVERGDLPEQGDLAPGDPPGASG